MNCKVAFIFYCISGSAKLRMPNLSVCINSLISVGMLTSWELSSFRGVAFNPEAVNCRAGPANLIYVCGSPDFTRKMDSMSCIQKGGNTVC